ncbi:MAG: phosphatidate cytidylyltransferase [Candidatus Omnitrophota bacterium]|nr:phosphatidate cytidylyltransferase [Candidatus Omnitrophota bacterium]
MMENNNLIPRFIWSLVLIALVVFTVFVFPNWFFCLVLTAMIAAALYEFYSLVEKKGVAIFKLSGIAIGIIVPLSIFFSFEPTKGWELLFIIAVLLAIFILQFTRKESNQAIVGVSTTIFGILYISWTFSFLMKLKMISEPYLPSGSLLVAFLILVTKSGDIGAYFIGTAFGKHHLIPRISPKKSVEGAVGGFIFSVAFAVLSKYYLPTIPVFHLVILGCLLGILAQVGDLSESLIKRDCQVKDSAGLIPGLGGILDLIDSILFTAPTLYFYVKKFLV